MNRSFLFIPSTIEKYILKIDTINADKFVIDLEDSIDNRDLDIAYTLIKKHKKIFINKQIFARVPKEICTYKILSFLASNGISGFIIPKIFSTRDLQKIIKNINKIKKKIDLILLAETTYSIVNLNDLVQLTNKFSGIMFGHEDYSLDIKIFEGKNKNKFSYAREKIVAVANANNLIPIESPYLLVKDNKGLEDYLKVSKETGFKGLICLSPTQCEIANNSFLPDERSYKLSKEIIRINKANKQKKNIIYTNSTFVGPPLVEQSELIIKTYENYKKKK